MDVARLSQLLERVRSGDIELEAALAELRLLPYEDVGIARIDHHRAVRTGFPEIVLGDSKTPEQVATIMERLAARNGTALCTRASPEAFTAVRAVLPHATYQAVPRMIVVRDPEAKVRELITGIAVVTAGTGDLPVAEEAATVAELAGHEVERIYDIGVAGLHRVLGALEPLHRACVIVVIAGMEGTLPGVIAGLVDVPVIAVPTSVGYGVSFSGIGPLLTMLNSCSLGLAVVNIDNGVGAGLLAAMINRQSHSTADSSPSRQVSPQPNTAESSAVRPTRPRAEAEL